MSSKLETEDSDELRTVLETLTDGIRIFDALGTMVSWNRAASRLFGIDEANPTIDSVVGKWEVIQEDGSRLPEDQRPLAVAMRARAAAEGTLVGLRSRTDGAVRWLSVSTSLIRNARMEITGYVSCSRDLTERMETIRALRVLNAAATRLSASLVPGDVATALTESASEICSPPGERPRRAVLRLVKSDALILSGLTDPTHTGAYASPVVPLADNPYARKVISTEKTLVTRFRPEDFGGSSSDVIRDAGVQNAAMVPMFQAGAIFAILAVSGRQETMISAEILPHLQALATMGELAFTNAEVHQQAALDSRTDPLTGLGNRRALDDRFRQLPRCPFSVVAIDVDHLKQVNDTHGHEAGDALLVSVATALASEIRPSDVIIRSGGDEFTALLVNCDTAGAREAAARLRDAVSGVSLPWGIPSVRIGCAAGSSGDAFQTILARADARLYRSKGKR